MPVEYLQSHTRLPMRQESRVYFILQSKNEMYLKYKSAIYRVPGEPLRFSYPADCALAAEFERRSTSVRLKRSGWRVDATRNGWGYSIARGHRPMKCYSIEFSIPDQRPFDKQATWFQSFVGSVILPVAGGSQMSRFWFTRYGGVGHGKTALFRFETEFIDEVFAEISRLGARFGISVKNPTDFDVGGDIGRGQGSRFLGTNAKHQDHARRGDLALSFLHASACLMLDCLVGPDPDGYFALESETVSGFSIESSLEQFHHLFCNMTCVPTYIAIAQSGTKDPIPVTYLELKEVAKDGWTYRQLRNGSF